MLYVYMTFYQTKLYYVSLINECTSVSVVFCLFDQISLVARGPEVVDGAVRTLRPDNQTQGDGAEGDRVYLRAMFGRKWLSEPGQGGFTNNTGY